MKIRHVLVSALLMSASCSFAAVAGSDSVEMNRFIDDLMSRMTLREKLGQLNLLNSGAVTTGASGQSTDFAQKIISGECGAIINARGVESIRELQDLAVKKTRLGIPLLFGLDVVHGYKTIFPIPLALSCSWDLAAIEEVARVSAREASADGIAWTYSPMVDISRDPRWGRVAEGAGEDPYLGARVAKAWVRGYQGRSLADKHNIMACVKHFALYGASEAGRDYNTVDMSRPMMYNFYFPPYKAGAEAGAGSFMSSFNTIDFVPATANRWLLTDVLRDQWGFNGFVVTDYTAIMEMQAHGLGDLEECSVRALRAGVDLDMIAEGFTGTLEQALRQGKISEEDIDTACRRMLRAKYELGLFKDPYLRIDPKRAATDIFTRESRDKARKIAAETFVLLKNENSILPLQPGTRIAVVGPYANSHTNLEGTWAVASDGTRYPTIYEAFGEIAGKDNVRYAMGSRVTDNPRMAPVTASFDRECPTTLTDRELLDQAVETARWADVIVAAVGETGDFSGESGSMVSIELQPLQQRLLKALKATGKPIVMLNFAGRPTILAWENENLDAILNVWFGGSEMAGAITDVVFGKTSPSGKTTMTFPRALGQIPIYYNHLNTGRPMADDNDPAFTRYLSNYIDVPNAPLFPFGYGLSYTTFEYSDFALSADEMTPDGSVTATVTVTNTGTRDADEVVQLYIRDLAATSSRPVKELKGFSRISLKAGESRQISFPITAEELSYYNYDLDYVCEPGLFHVTVGPNSRDTLAPLQLRLLD